MRGSRADLLALSGALSLALGVRMPFAHSQDKGGPAAKPAAAKKKPGTEVPEAPAETRIDKSPCKGSDREE